MSTTRSSNTKVLAHALKLVEYDEEEVKYLMEKVKVKSMNALASYVDLDRLDDLTDDQLPLGRVMEIPKLVAYYQYEE